MNCLFYYVIIRLCNYPLELIFRKGGQKMETFDSFMKAPWAPIVVMVIIIAIVIIVNAVGNSRKKK